MVRHSQPTACGNKKCSTVNTPLWRKGWTGENGKTVMLCNACGLHFKKGHFCIYCKQIYRESDADDGSWISCERCSRWTHRECEKKKGYRFNIDDDDDDDHHQSARIKKESEIIDASSIYLCLECRTMQEKLGMDQNSFNTVIKKRRKKPSYLPETSPSISKVSPPANPSFNPRSGGLSSKNKNIKSMSKNNQISLQETNKDFVHNSNHDTNYIIPDVHHDGITTTNIGNDNNTSQRNVSNDDMANKLSNNEFESKTKRRKKEDSRLPTLHTSSRMISTLKQRQQYHDTKEECSKVNANGSDGMSISNKRVPTRRKNKKRKGTGIVPSISNNSGSGYENESPSTLCSLSPNGEIKKSGMVHGRQLENKKHTALLEEHTCDNRILHQYESNDDEHEEDDDYDLYQEEEYDEEIVVVEDHELPSVRVNMDEVCKMYSGFPTTRATKTWLSLCAVACCELENLDSSDHNRSSQQQNIQI